jgi:hypothetical protein
MPESELKEFLVLFKDGHTVTVKAQSYNGDTGVFLKADGKVDSDIWIRTSELLAVVPKPKQVSMAM